jgi:hypothetical protein
MALTTFVKNFRDGKITIKDGTGTPLTYEVTYEPGDFTLTDPRYNYTTVLDRGEVGASAGGVRKTNKEPGSFSFSGYLLVATDSNDLNLIDAIKGTGAAAAWVSTGSVAFDRTLRTVVFEMEGSTPDGADSVFTCTLCAMEVTINEGELTTINVEGVIYGEVTRTGPT